MTYEQWRDEPAWYLELLLDGLEDEQHREDEPMHEHPYG